MDTFLNEEEFIELQGIVSEEIFEKLQSLEKPTTIWLRDNDKYMPSSNLNIENKLIPGMYSIKVSQEHGLHCVKNNFESDDIYKFNDSVTTDLFNEIELFWKKKDIYEKNDLIHKRGILLQGKSGTGKSSIISILSEEIIKNKGIVFKIDSFKSLENYINFLVYHFRIIEPDTPVITIIEDIDKYVDYSELVLDFLDGKTQINHHIIIATTNDSSQIPDNFLRPSRIDLIVEIDCPIEEIRRDYFIKKDVPTEMIEELVKASEGFSFADLKEFYITIFLLDYSVDKAREKINTPREKKNYLTNNLKTNKLAI